MLISDHLVLKKNGCYRDPGTTWPGALRGHQGMDAAAVQGGSTQPGTGDHLAVWMDQQMGVGDFGEKSCLK